MIPGNIPSNLIPSNDGIGFVSAGTQIEGRDFWNLQNEYLIWKEPFLIILIASEKVTRRKWYLGKVRWT